MRLYSMKKIHIFFFSIVFITVMSIAILIGLLGPPVLTRNNQYASKIVPNGLNLHNGFYKVTSDPVLLFQREIWFSAIIHQKHPDGRLLI